MRGLSLVAASGGHCSSRCAGLSPSWPLLLRSTGSRCAGSVVVAHGLSCSAAYGIFPDQGSNPCPLHWQANSQSLQHQGSPAHIFGSAKWEVFGHSCTTPWSSPWKGGRRDYSSAWLLPIFYFSLIKVCTRGVNSPVLLSCINWPLQWPLRKPDLIP